MYRLIFYMWVAWFLVGIFRTNCCSSLAPTEKSEHFHQPAENEITRLNDTAVSSQRLDILQPSHDSVEDRIWKVLKQDFIKDWVKTEIATEMRNIRRKNEQLKRQLHKVLRLFRHLTEDNQSYKEGCLKQLTCMDEREFDLMKTELAAVKSELNATRQEFNTTKSELAAVKTELNATRQELNTTKSELAAAKSELNAAKQEINITKSELAAMKSELNAARQELNTTKSELAAVKSELNAAKQEINITKSELAAVNSELNAAKQEINITKSELAAVKPWLNATSEELHLTKTELTAVNRSLNAVSQELKLTETELAAAKPSLNTMNQELKSVNKELVSLKKLTLSDVLVCPPSSQCKTCQPNVHRLSVFDGKAVNDFPLLTHEGLEYLMMCTRTCNKDTRCRSYTYNKKTRRCSLYGVGYSLPENTFTSVSQETGSELYIMCGRTHSFGTTCRKTADCEYSNSYCMKGSCQCAVGYSYDVKSGECVKICLHGRYGNYFGMFFDHGIDGCNTKKTFAWSGSACEEACRKESSFVCVNSEYQRRSGKCQLCDLTWFDIHPSNRKTDDIGWNLYYRHCAY